MRGVGIVLLGIALTPHGAAAQGLVVFEQEHCPACTRMAPAVTRLEAAGVRIVRYEARAGDPVCRALAIRRTPTFVVFDRQGRETGRLVGAVRQTELQALARGALRTTP